MFNNKNEGEVEDFKPRKIRDLKPENVKARKEPVLPWGIKERLFVLITLLLTVGLSGFLALSARNFKIPSVKKIDLPDISEINPFKEKIILVGSQGSKISQEKIENTKRLFKEATNEYSGIYAFYIYDLNGDYYYGLNYKDTMQAASLIKLPVMYMMMKEDNNDGLVEAMGQRSDNEAFKKAVSIIGKENVNKEILNLGMINTSLTENTTTPEEIGLFFKKLYKGELLDNDKTEKLKEYMTDTIFENWIRPGIPESIKLVHKYGREVHVVNDAGIVESSKPFVMVIMTDGVIEREADELFPKLSKLLYDEHVKQ